MNMRKLPLALAVASVVLSAQAMAVDFHGYARSGIGWSSQGGDQKCFQADGPVPNTVLATSVIPTPN